MKYEARSIPAAEAEAEVVRLWNQRASRANDAIFRWGYLASPVAPGHCFLLRAIDGATESFVGTVSIGSRRVHVGGETLSAAILGDFFVVKAHRTFFPALTLQRAALTWARKNFDLVYGFPNESARPVIKRLGFKEMARFERWVLVLRHHRYLVARLQSKLAARALAIPLDGIRRFVHPRISFGASRGLRFERFERVDTLDQRFDRLFRKRAFQDFTIGARDAKLVQWRFLERPDQRGSVYGLSDRSGELRAYVAIHRVDDIAIVGDLFGVDVDAMAEALRLVSGVARAEGCVALSFSCCAPPLLAARLFRLGFRMRPEAKGTEARTLFGHVADNVTNAHVLSTLQRWYATEADEDQ